MKLHLPKLLLSALLAVYCCASSAAEEKALFDNLSYGGNFYASSYQFSFILDNVEANGNVVAAFWGTVPTGNLGANAFTLTSNDNGATYILTTGSGKLGDTDIDAETTFALGSNGTNSQIFAGSLQTGIVYTVTGTCPSPGGANAASSTIDSIYIDPVTTGKYNANMNGTDGASNLDGGVNSAYAVSTNSALIWAGTGDAAAWGTWVNASGQSVTETATTSNIYFDASTTVAKSLSISSVVNVNSINVYDNYTFNLSNGAAITANSLRVASDKTLILNSQEDNNTVNFGSITLAQNATLDLTAMYGAHLVYAEWEALERQVTSTGDGAFIKVKTNHNGAQGGELKLGGLFTLTHNYELTGRLDIHASSTGGGSHALKITNGATLKSEADIMMVSQGKLLIDNGHVQAAALRLGHEASGNHQGYLEMKSGSLTVSTFQLMQADNKANHSNEILITGGSLEFTTENAITRYSNTESTINITGTSANAPVVLKATKVAWTLDGSGLTTAPTMGNIKVDAGNTYAITLKNVALSGSVVGNGKFTLGGAIASDDAVLDGALTLDNVTFSGDKVTLQEDARATVANMSDISSLLPQLTGTGTLVLASDAFIAGAAKSTNTTTVYDFAGNIEVTGGVLRLGDNAGSGISAMKQLEMKSATIKLNGGGLRYFGGDSTLGHIDVDASATLDVYATNNGETAQGTLTIEELDVAADKMLTISGQWDRNVDIETLTGDGALQIEKPTDKADSDSVVNIDSISFGALKAKGGYINIQAGEHTLKTLDIAINKSSTASVTLKEKAELAIGDGGLWMYNQTSLKLEKDASLTHGVINIKGLSSTEDGRASIKTSVTNATGQPDGQYSITRADYTISNAEVTVTSDANQTLANKLSDSQIVNAGAGELKLTHADNALSGIKAMAGNISFESLQDQTLESLYIAEGKTVNVGEATLSIQEAATTNGSKVTNVTFGNGAKLQGNLVLQSGASVSLGTDVQIDGTLTLGYGMELTGAQLEAIENLKNNADERVALFSNVDALKLADAATFSTNSVAVDYTGAQDLSNFFSNVDNGVYMLEFDQNVVYATLIPEPTTTTLSLLALAALAARRRRR